MGDMHSKTIRLRRPAKIRTNEHGRSVWAEPVEEIELELMSSQTLEAVLAKQEAAATAAIDRIVNSDTDGVVVRECATGLYCVISEDDLLEAIDANGGNQGELNLLKTQELRKMVSTDRSAAGSDEDASGFDPYDRN